MASRRQDFAMHAGDDVEVAFVTTEKDGTPQDLTGTSVSWQMAVSPYATSPLVSKTTAGGITLTDAVNGQFTVFLAAADTLGLNGRFYHEAQVTDSSGNISTVALGWVTLETGLVP